MRAASRLTAGWLIRSVLLFGLWMALVDNDHSAELMAGAGCAVIGALAGTLTARLGVVPARPTPKLLRRAYRPLVLLVTDTVRVTVALVKALAGRPVRGRFRATPYRPAGPEHERSARRVLTELAGSLGPNRYVLGIDDEHDALLVHELVAAEGPHDPLDLG